MTPLMSEELLEQIACGNCVMPLRRQPLVARLRARLEQEGARYDL